MTTAAALDAEWRAAHPLPPHDGPVDKNSRGTVLLVGGARFVPGALALTGEAALRAGAGKLQMATVEPVALALGVLVPEAAMTALPMRDDGEIAAAAVDILRDRIPRCDVLLLGPGMSRSDETSALVDGLLGLRPPAVLLDAAALTCCNVATLRRFAGDMPLILTPHHGEMARLVGVARADIARDPAAMVTRVARESGAIVVLKGAETFIAAPDGEMLVFGGGCPGLATSGSGDVLAGIIGGLVARGAEPLTAAAWGVAAHGAAGNDAAHRIGRFGFLARDLLPRLPAVLHDAAFCGT
ncbi:hydroxyethylthiazole kinase-like uncharacterized protein yjeF [Sphingomonas zeicaulis]|uniref:NAD(P)H-hydrate dehydratase n=1 Tax=Sphingomonas zeicaulis TaxID=1632740 RepID=UPI003D2216C2